MNIKDIYKIPGLSEVDNLAYRLYWSERKNKHVVLSYLQFLKNKNTYTYYYDKSILLLRKEKLKKLSEI